MEELEIQVKDLTDADPKALAEEIVRVLDRRKAGDIKLLHVTEKTILADYFVLCTGNSSTQVRGLAGEVEYRIGLDGVAPARQEGLDGGGWILMDYHTVIVHVFTRDARQFYNLDKLWSEAEEIDLSSLLIE